MASLSDPKFKPGLQASAPTVDQLISDLLAYHLATDPADAYGFSTRELWEWRYATYGYGRLFADWLLTAEEV